MKTRLLSIFLCTFIILGTAPLGAISATAESGNGISQSTVDMTLSGTNAVGEMLAAELSAAQSSQSTGNVIYSVEAEDNIAVAELSTAVSCTLFIGIYTEDGLSLVSSGSDGITPETEYAEITLSSAVPQYFYIKAFLVDSEDFSPLSAVYESPLYTKEMQEFLSKTTADFEEDRVVNFDDSTDNNFAVLSEAVVALDESSQKNKITYADTVNDIYTIENIDESVSSLKAEDTFSGVYNGETVIVKIGEIAVDGGTATILGEDTELNEVFDYVKLDATAGITEASVDSDSCGEGVTFDGYEYGTEARAVDIGGSVGTDAKFSFKLAKKGNDNVNVTVAGNVKLQLVFSPKLYISLNYKYLELKLDYSLGGSVSVKGKLETEIPLAFISIGVPGVRAELVPAFVFSASGSIEITGTLIKGTLGYGWYSDVGGVNLTSAPKSEAEIKAAVTVFLGVRLAPEIKILGGKLADASLEVDLGAELKATASANTSDILSDSKRHDCNACVKGEIYGKFSMTVKGKLLNNEEWSLSMKFLEVKLKISDFYWSITHGEFAFTACPHISYKLTLTVTDQSGTPVKKANIALNGKTYSTTESGTLSLYLPNGSYKATATANDYISSEKAFTVLNASKGVTLTLESINLINAQSLSLGYEHSAAITESGDLYMWGSNEYGQLGNGTTTDSDTPIKIMSNVSSLSLGNVHSAAITKSGDLYMWGYNYYGQLGNGTTTDSNTPVKIMSNIASLCLGSNHSAVVTKSGDLYMWGWNYLRQLGDGTTTDSNTPLKIMSDVSSVSLGDYHSAAITKSGDLYTWGYNGYRQLGNGTTAAISYKPVKIMSNMASASLGRYHSGAVTESGDLYMWGGRIMKDS